ncbi:MAG: ATP-binding protein [Candidatus Aminicenantes bacterium]|jgi:ATP-dependent DNA helicase RecG
MKDSELLSLLKDLESDSVERKGSMSHPDRIREAICAFANDLPGNQKPGVIFIGAKDDGSCANLTIDDKLLLDLAKMRDDGAIQPFPSMEVKKKTLNGCKMAVVIVQPSLAPPIRFKGRTWVRVGPRRAIATPEEELRLTEKRRSLDLPYDLRPLSMANIDDFDIELFEHHYLPNAVAPKVVGQNKRKTKDQLKALRFLSPQGIPTILGMLVIGKESRNYIPGAYIQFLRIDGTELTDPIRSQKEISGPLNQLLGRLDDILEAHNNVSASITAGPVEIRHSDYPIPALQQLCRNAVLHRTYEGTTAPVRVYWFSDRIEIHSPGGPFGQVTKENFGHPGITDYRNPHLAEAMKVLGYVQRFGVGIQIARQELEKNGNPPLQFQVESTNILVTVKKRKE